MTKITFFTSEGVFWGFEETGHTMYADEGNDVLCAALSSMTMLIINTIEVGFGSRVDYTIDEKSTTIKSETIMENFCGLQRLCLFSTHVNMPVWGQGQLFWSGPLFHLSLGPQPLVL